MSSNLVVSQSIFEWEADPDQFVLLSRDHSWNFSKGLLNESINVCVYVFNCVFCKFWFGLLRLDRAMGTAGMILASWKDLLMEKRLGT